MSPPLAGEFKEHVRRPKLRHIFERHGHDGRFTCCIAVGAHDARLYDVHRDSALG
jgi:hypothetical protein